MPGAIELDPITMKALKPKKKFKLKKNVNTNQTGKLASKASKHDLSPADTNAAVELDPVTLMAKRSSK